MDAVTGTAAGPAPPAGMASDTIPRSVDLADSLPRTETGTLQKHKLRERNLSGATT